MDKEMTKEKIVSQNYPNIIQSFGIIGITILLQLLSPLLIALVLGKFIKRPILFFISYTLSMFFSLLIINLIRKRKTGESSFKLQIKNKGIIPFLIAGTITLYFGVIIPILTIIMALISYMLPNPEKYEHLLMPSNPKLSFLIFILFVVVAPILEEFIFRGIILDGLLKSYSPLKAILISSFLFGILHFKLLHFIGVLIISIFWGWIYYITQSLSFSVIMHATHNFVVLMVSYFISINSFIWDTLIEDYASVIGLIILASIIILSICIYNIKKECIDKK